jgi:U3 small nucleolar RNA-associated protein 10
MKCLEYDKEDFVDKSRFDTLSGPLISQLENTLGSTKVQEERANKYVIPCIVQLAVNIGKEALWKPMNYQICLCTRNPQAAVRLSAVKTLLSLYNKLQEKYLIFVPESVQYIAELMEDVNHDVENATQQLVAVVDGLLGDKNGISSYLQK